MASVGDFVCAPEGSVLGFVKVVSVFASGERRERKQKRCDPIWWRWTLNISKWSLPLFVHAVSRVPACPLLLPAAPFPPVPRPPALRALGARSRSWGRVLRGWAGERQERARDKRKAGSWSQQHVLMLQEELVLDYLLTSKLPSMGNGRRVWLGFMRTSDSACAAEQWHIIEMFAL